MLVAWNSILLRIIVKCCGCPSKNNDQEKDSQGTLSVIFHLFAFSRSTIINWRVSVMMFGSKTSLERAEPFSCKNVLLFQYTSIAAGHVSENALLTVLFCLNVLFSSMYRSCDLTHKETRFWNFVIDQLANISKVENYMNYIGKQSIQPLIKIRYLGSWLNQILQGLVFTFRHFINTPQ